MRLLPKSLFGRLVLVLVGAALRREVPGSWQLPLNVLGCLVMLVLLGVGIVLMAREILGLLWR